MFSLIFKNFIKQTLTKQGYEASFHRISKTPYTGQKVAFVHIAKCGGTSVDFALRTALALPGQRRIDKTSSIAASMASYEGEYKSLEGNCKFSEHHAQNLHKIFSYYLEQNWQYISGHVTITEEIINRYCNNYAFITILRNPVERLISNYIFNKLTNKKSIMLPNNLNTDDVIKEANLLLNSKRGWQMANSSTMYLTGRFPKDVDDAKNMQKEVYNNLKKFRVIGYLDDLDSFEKDCSTLTGQEISIGKRNITKSLNSPEQMRVQNLLKEFFDDKQTKALINKLCLFELENYNKIRSSE